MLTTKADIVDFVFAVGDTKVGLEAELEGGDRRVR